MAVYYHWLDALAWTRAVADSLAAEVDINARYQHYFYDWSTIRAAVRAWNEYPDFSNEELEALVKSLQACRSRPTNGATNTRQACLCRVFNIFKAANGGQLPAISAWEHIYEQQCAPSPPSV